MTLKIVVTAKQVIDPETPTSAFGIADNAVTVPANQASVVNGFDEQAIEAALRLKDASGDAHITVVSVGSSFALDVIKKPLAMGADELILLDDPAFDNAVDPTVTIAALTAAVRKIGDVNIVLAGRQASDWDNAQVPIGVAEALGWPVATVAKKVDVKDSTLRVERVLPDGHEVVEADLPAVVTVSNELGTPRYPNMRGIMAARRVQPTVWSAADVGLDIGSIRPAFELVSLSKPQSAIATEMITGDDDEDAGRKLAQRLRDERII
jgi:electron transfer flavoprotein beta subunit